MVIAEKVNENNLSNSHLKDIVYDGNRDLLKRL